MNYEDFARSEDCFVKGTGFGTREAADFSY
jgi:hypothetical protein